MEVTVCKLCRMSRKQYRAQSSDVQYSKLPRPTTIGLSGWQRMHRQLLETLKSWTDLVRTFTCCSGQLSLERRGWIFAGWSLCRSKRCSVTIRASVSRCIWLDWSVTDAAVTDRLVRDESTASRCCWSRLPGTSDALLARERMLSQMVYCCTEQHSRQAHAAAFRWVIICLATHQ